MRNLPPLLLIAAFAGCTNLPDIPEPPGSVSADYPPLVPLDQLPTDTAAVDAEALRTEQEIAARVASLRARAARLRSAEVN